VTSWNAVSIASFSLMRRPPRVDGGRILARV